MTDLEFEILDELYFIIAFDELRMQLALEEQNLKKELHSLINKGWVRCMLKGSDDVVETLDSFDSDFKKYNYLATKAGLLAHNGK